MSKKLYIIFLIILAPFYANASNLTEDSAKNLLDQLSAAMNSQEELRIQPFLEYYIKPEAIFKKTSIIMAKDTTYGQPPSKDVIYNKADYIAYMLRTAQIPIQYTYTATLNSFIPTKDNKFAIINVQIDERSIVIDRNELITKSLIALISTNCNFALEATDALPKITGANCIEKIVPPENTTDNYLLNESTSLDMQQYLNEPLENE